MAKRNGSSPKMPDLRNATPMYITDELGAIRDQQKGLKKLEGYFKDALLARVSAGSVTEGENYTAQVSSESRTTLDTKGIREEMGPDWCSERSQTTDFIKVSTKKAE